MSSAPFTHLYATAAKGIQDYIFRTNKLKDMIGASAIIRNLPVGALKTIMQSVGIDPDKDVTWISQAAGAARCLLSDKSKAEDLVRVWPAFVAQYAPGLDVVQALVPIAGGLEAARREAEAQMQIARQYASPSLPVPGPLVERNPRTGLGVNEKDPDSAEWVDSQVFRKREAGKDASLSLVTEVIGSPFDQSMTWPENFDDLAGHDSYLAVIHIDVNGLGHVMQAAPNAQKDLKQAASTFLTFSNQINACTHACVKAALTPILQECLDAAQKKKTGSTATAPVRVIVCAGDDLTLVIKSRYAMRFTKAYLEEFGQRSKSDIALCRTAGLTAAAGVVFVKTSFPFSQSYATCESLCKFAKKKTDRLASAVAFYCIKDSVAREYPEVVERDLTTRDKVVLTMNPYVVGTTPRSGLAKLEDCMALARIAGEDLPRGSLRELVSSIHSDKAQAHTDYERICEVQEKRAAWPAFVANLEKMTGTGNGWLSGDSKTPLLDMIELASVGKED